MSVTDFSFSFFLFCRLVPSIAALKGTMIGTMIEHETRRMAQHCDPIVQTLLVTAHETETMCTKALMHNEYEIKKETETIVRLVKENVHGTQTEGITTIEDPQKTNLRELVTGPNMLALQERNITTTVNLKFLSGKSLVIGSTGKRTKNMSVTENDTDVIGIVIVIESTTDSLIHRLGTVVHRSDIPVLTDLVLCRIVITAVVATAICHLLVQWILETTIELTNRSHLILCLNRPSRGDIVMVSTTFILTLMFLSINH